MSLNVHFLNVGHGDCTIIEFPSGRRTMVDINNSRVLDEDTAMELAEGYGYSGELYRLYKSLGLKPKEIQKYEESLADPVDFYLARYGRDAIFRYIQTHPDMDHMTGLYRLYMQERVPIINFWDTKHSVEKSDDPKDWENTPYDIRDWRLYKRLRMGQSDPKALFYRFNDQHSYFAEDGVRIWAPFTHQPDISEDDRVNMLSYILLIKYGTCKILLGGDALKETWQTLYDAVDGKMPKIHLLKASHHGRKSGYCWQAVKAMSPDYTVVSVGKLLKKDDAFAGYEKYSIKGCFSTRFEGTITARCWLDGDVWFYDQDGNRL